MRATCDWASALWLQQHSESAFFGTPCNCKYKYKYKYKYLQIVGRLGLPRGRADSAPWEFHSLSIFGLQLIPAELHQQAVQSLLAQYKYMSSSVRPKYRYHLLHTKTMNKRLRPGLKTKNWGGYYYWPSKFCLKNSLINIPDICHGRHGHVRVNLL